MTALRYHVSPGDAPAEVVARRLGLTKAQFVAARPNLLARGFPKEDETTGLYDLDAVDEWRRQRHPQLYLTAKELARDAKVVVRDRLEALRNG